MVKNKRIDEFGAVKAEMDKPRVAGSVREEAEGSDDDVVQITGYGRISSMSGKSGFRVEFALTFMRKVPLRKSEVPRALNSGCVECWIESVEKRPIPDGDYVLTLENDGAHHVKKVSGQWIYLSLS